MNEKGLHRLLSANRVGFYPQKLPLFPISAVSMSMRSMCSWILGPLKFLHQHGGMFVATLGSVPRTPIENHVFFHFFPEHWIVHISSFICLWFSNGALLYESKDLVESDGDVTVCGNPHKWLRILLRSSGEIDEVSQSKNQSINQLRSEMKWNYLRIFLFQWKHLKNPQNIPNGHLSNTQTSFPPLGSIYLKSSTSTLSDQTQPVVQTLQPFQSSATRATRKICIKPAT